MDTKQLQNYGYLNFEKIINTYQTVTYASRKTLNKNKGRKWGGKENFMDPSFLMELEKILIGTLN